MRNGVIIRDAVAASDAREVFAQLLYIPLNRSAALSLLVNRS
jgi:hypothetical protein